jgi:flagellar basal-body rod modification protein FlgD
MRKELQKMSSIWNSAVTQAGSSPFATTGIAPTPGGGASAKFQSLLQSAGKTAPSDTPSGSQLGLSPKSNAAAGNASYGSASAGKVTAMDSSTSGTDDSGASISANDFLTLLVTEMQNQDPTAQTDPNEYINQLVQINSLEQLISINQNLADVLGAASSATPSGANAGTVAPVGAVTSATSTPAVSQAQAPTGVRGAAGGSVVSGSHSFAHGNLSVPKPTPASQSVAHSLDGHSRAGRPGHGVRDIPTGTSMR